MAITVILHAYNQDPIVGEVDELPKPGDQSIKVSNLRYRDGRELHFLDHSATSVIWPLSQLTFIEVLAGEEEEGIIGFVRE